LTDDAVLARVLQIVVGQAGADRAPPDASPDTALGEAGFWLDSVDLLEIVLACESEFDVAFESEVDLTPEALATVRTLGALIARKRGV
jgi:acyl carrier protein